MPGLPVFNITDKRLAKRVLRKEKGAFDEFYAAYFPRIYRFCLFRTRGSDAESHVEDIVQDTMIKALRGLTSYRGEAALLSWLCQICNHEIVSWHRRNGKASKALLSIELPSVQAGLESRDIASHQEAAEAELIRHLVHLSLECLPHDYARALELKYLAGCSVREVARKLDRTVLATQSLLARARAAFARSYRYLSWEIANE
ncbi:MAG: RNA polymerase sigma factor [Gammaproteobacteria bacterium]|nr:RNA polymerase sigma factor [Gammaproteobacteria bacterium]